MNSIQVPLYTRSSDRSIADCPAQWHIYSQGIEENTASWFEIGTALHEAVEVIIKKIYSLRTARTVAWGKVTERIKRYEEIKPMLWSPNRPSEFLEELSKRLITNWYKDWMTVPRLLKNVRWPPRTEVTIQVSSDLMPSGLAGIKTQADALFKCRKCNGFVIVDWKTGRTRNSDPLQLQTYRYGLELLGKIACSCERGWGFFYHLEHRKLQQVESYDEEEVEWMIIDSQRMKKEPIEAIPSWKCDWCVGRSVCPVWQEDEYDAEAQYHLLEFNRNRYEWVTDPV